MKYLAMITLALIVLSCENKGKKVINEETANEVATEEKVEKVLIKGTLYSANDSTPISMSMILVPGTNIGSISDENGAFSISIPEASKKLQFVADGHESMKVEVTPNMENTIYLKPK